MPRGGGSRGGESIRCEPGDFARLQGRVADWDRVLQGQLKAELGAAAKPAARLASRNALRLRLPGLPPSARPHGRSSGLRSDLSRSVNVILRVAGNGVEYRITSDHPMTKPTNSTSFRHPVYGHRDRPWVTQASQPWWTMAMDKSRPAMRDAAERALDRAARRIR